MGNKKGQFKKGQSGNPDGRPKMSAPLKEFRKVSYEDFLTNLQKYGAFTKSQMADELLRDDLTMFESMFASIVEKAAAGDKDARAVILDRLWGKVFYKADNGSHLPGPHPTGSNLPTADTTNGGPQRPQVVFYMPVNGREAVDPTN